MTLGNRGQREPKHSSSRSGRQTSTSRGDQHSSGKSKPFDALSPTASRALRDATNHSTPTNSKYKGKNYDSNYKPKHAQIRSIQPPPQRALDTFDQARVENEAKRAQGTTSNTVNGRKRGNATGQFNNISVRFNDQKHERSSKPPVPSNSTTFAQKSAMATNTFNPFARPQDASRSHSPAPTGFGVPSQGPTRSPSPAVNGFGVLSQPTTTNPFLGTSSGQSIFGAPSQPASSGTSSPFGAPSQVAALSNPFGTPSMIPPTTVVSTNPFGAPSRPASANSTVRNPFSSVGTNTPTTASNLSSSKASAQLASTNSSAANVFGGTSTFGAAQTPSSYSSAPQSTTPASKSWGAPSNGTLTSGSNFFAKAPSAGQSANGTFPPAPSSITFGTNLAKTVQAAQDPMTTRAARFGTSSGAGTSAASGRPQGGNKSVAKNFAPQISKTAFQQQDAQSPIPSDNSGRSSESLAKKVKEVLRKERISPPKWPGWDFKDKRPVGQHERVKKYWNDFREYQGKVRNALIRANVIDDPEVPKRLSEAIDFKGTCEEMCPEWERVDRIISGRVDDAEKEISADGSVSRFPSLEKMVKALARSAAGQEAPLPDEVRSAAALRKTVDYLFGTVLGDSDLPTVYTFLWDRTRAVRRDFVFHSFMNKAELHDQVNCLEKIVRFHVIAAHQMSRDGVNTQGFSEQQELEQLGKSLLSLIHAYEDCSAQGIVCENETEFRAYHILWGARSNPGILEEVQNWDWKFWGESEVIQLAVSLVEALQTPWDTLPLKPRAETDIAHNAFSRFFAIIEDKRVSYTMACFAETFFNHVRFSILRTILKSYRKQKQQTKDWTIPKLNEYLRFDDEEDVIPFCESHGLHFDVVGELEYLSFDVSGEVTQPSPPLKQGYSHDIVERKRGQYSLPDAINRSLYDDTSEELSHPRDEVAKEEDSLFVEDGTVSQWPAPPLAKSEAKSFKAATNGYDWNSAVQTGSEDKSTPVIESILQPASEPASIFGTAPAPRSFNSIFAIPSPTATSTSLQPSSSPSLFQQLSSSETSSILGKHTDRETYPALAPSTAIEAPTETSSIKPATTFSFLQQPTLSQDSVENHSQPSEKLTAIGVPNAPNFFQEVPGTSSTLLPQPQPEDVNHVLFSNSDTQPVTNQFTSHKTQFPTGSPPETLQTNNSVELVKEPSIKPSEDKVPVLPTPGPAPLSRASKIAAVAEWVALGSDGLMDQFIASQVELILHDTARVFMEEEAARIEREADETARNEADNFRYHSLATRYARMWRENARLQRLKRRGRVARQARRDLAESMRASKAAQSANIVEDFRASTRSRRRGSLESLLDVSGVLDGVHHSNNEVLAIAHEYQPSPKRQRSERSISSTTSGAMKHKRGQSEHQTLFRRSLLSDPTYLHGGSRIHLISDYDAKKESSPQVSGVATDYFRLKARGITTLPDGTPLANSVTSNPIRKKSSFDGFIKPTTPRHPKVVAAAHSVPAKRSGGFANSHEEIRLLKARAKDVMAEDQMSRQKRAYVDEEEELFERAKRVREQMDEGATWYRKEIERETASRSVS